MSAIQNRYEFVYFFDVTNGNPNGDPDAGNMPRLDPESSKGLVTDVCLKRKIRNFVEISSENEAGYEIYVKEKSVLNLQNKRAYEALGIESEAKKLPKDEAKARDITAWMCKNFFDIRTFGAVMTTEVNSGQVRGPVQLAFAQSIDPIVPHGLHHRFQDLLRLTEARRRIVQVNHDSSFDATSAAPIAPAYLPFGELTTSLPRAFPREERRY